jgi:chromosome partitioning protein
MAGFAMIYAVANQKGGVGKTTSAVNLAACLADTGAKVLLIDLDPQANASSGLGFREVEGPTVVDVVLDGAPMRSAILATRIPQLDIVPSSPDLSGAAIELPQREGREYILTQAIAEVVPAYEYIFIDCPPSLDLLAINAFAAADRMIIPVQCEYYALEGLSRLMETIRGVRNHLNPGLGLAGLLLTMHDIRTRVSTDVVTEVRRHFPDSVFATVIPRNVRITEAPSYGEPVTRYDPQCAGAQAYIAAAQEVIARG